jgi:hemin uptake protein HemP
MKCERSGEKKIGHKLSKAAPVISLDIKELFKGTREVRLRHRNAEYRLRLTKSDKLILTK